MSETPDKDVSGRPRFYGLRLTRWAALWRSDSSLGVGRHLLWGEDRMVPALFKTRREAREWIEDKYGYIRTRPDLKREPHRWRVPLAVKVYVRFSVAEPTL